MNQTWTPEKRAKWQDFYNTAPRFVFYGAGASFNATMLPSIPKYEDLKPVPCIKSQTTSGFTYNTVSYTTPSPNSAMHWHMTFIFPLITVVLAHLFIQ